MDLLSPDCVGRLLVGVSVASAPFVATLAAGAAASFLPRGAATLDVSAGPWLRQLLVGARLDRRLALGVTPDVAEAQSRSTLTTGGAPRGARSLSPSNVESRMLHTTASRASTRCQLWPSSVTNSTAAPRMG